MIIHKNTWLKDTINLVFSISILTIIISLLINSQKYARCGASINIPMVLIFFVMISVFLFISYRLISNIDNHMMRSFIISFGLLFFVQVTFSYFSYTVIGWDVMPIINHASGVYPFEDYFYMYPNNTLLCFIFKIWFAAFSVFGLNSFWFEAIILNIIMVDLTILLICLIAKNLFDTKGMIITYMLSILLIGFSPYITVPYSDTIGMLFIVLTIYLAYNIFKNKSVYLNFSLLILTMLLGYKIKPTVIIVGLVCLFFLFINWLIKKQKFISVKSLIILGCLVVGVSGYSLINYISRNVVFENNYSKSTEQEQSIPLTHYIMMGLKETVIDINTSAFGTYSQADADNTFSISGKSDKVEYNLHEISSRANQLGFAGVINLAINKFIWVTTDGSFYYGGEGDFHAGTIKSISGISGFLQNFTYIESNIYQKYYLNYLQALWLLILSLCFISSISKRSYSDFSSLLKPILQLSILGCFIFLMIFEARPRYVFVFKPIFILLSTHGASRLNEVFSLDKSVQKNNPTA